MSCSDASWELSRGQRNKKINVVLNIQRLRWEVPRGASGVMKLFQLVLRWSEQLRLGAVEYISC